MDVHEAQRQVCALTPEQLRVVVAYVHGSAPEVIERAIDVEKKTRSVAAAS